MYRCVGTPQRDFFLRRLVMKGIPGWGRSSERMLERAVVRSISVDGEEILADPTGGISGVAFGPESFLGHLACPRLKAGRQLIVTVEGGWALAFGLGEVPGVYGYVPLALSFA